MIEIKFLSDNELLCLYEADKIGYGFFMEGQGDEYWEMIYEIVKRWKNSVSKKLKGEHENI